jgi:hypothetical protein
VPADATASITFMPTSREQAPVATVAIVNGAYDSPNTPQGAVKASFSILQPAGPVRQTDRGTSQDVKDLVPSNYATGIEIQVSDDNSKQDFDLK